MYTQKTHPKILIIGAASLDTYHFAGQIQDSVGGAGLYAALAAARMESDVSMLGPRLDPIPTIFQPIIERVQWIGPLTTADRFCHFDIEYKDHKTTYLEYDVSAEAELNPADLPANIAEFAGVHITALSCVSQQLDFLQACRSRSHALISAGTCGHDISTEPEMVRKLIAAADIFFLNHSEAEHLFGRMENAQTRPGAVLVITLGEQGALVIQGSFATHIPGVQASELDPTGAGDTFCGATLAGIVNGYHPILAARRAAVLSAHMISALGPNALLDDSALDFERLDPRIALDPGQIERISAQAAAQPAIAPHNFIEPCLPAEGHPAMLDFIFATTLQQFSFWETENGRYHHPLLAPLDGQVSKGAEYLWRAYMRRLDDQPELFTPAGQLDPSEDELADLYRADDGTNPMPAFDLHYEIARAYAQDMLALDLTPQKIVEMSNLSPTPIKTFLEILDKISGYKEDPLRKKSSLLVEILVNRPERFLKPAPDEKLDPIVDYHNMRACLRMGLVDIVDSELKSAVAQRKLISAEDEWAVRFACYRAIELCAALSGKGVEGVGQFFFNSRKYCPEMTKPDCASCLVDSACAHRTELFQPVFRTTFY